MTAPLSPEEFARGVVEEAERQGGQRTPFGFGAPEGPLGAEDPARAAELQREREERFALEVLAGAQAQEIGVPDEELARLFVNRLTGQETLEPGRLLVTREDLAFRADTPEERQLVFAQRFPEGQLLRIPGTTIDVFRRDPQSPFEVLDPSIADVLRDPQGRIVPETIADLEEAILPDAPEILGEIAVALALRGPAPSALKQIILQAPAAIAGEAGRQAVQTLTGTQAETLGGQTRRALGEGFLSIVGGTLGAGLGAGVNVVRGGGIFRKTPEGEAAMLSAARRDLPAPTPGQVVSAPFLRRMERQTAAVLSEAQNYVRDQEKRARDLLRGLRDRSELAGVTRRVGEEVGRGKNQIQEAVGRVLRNPGRSATEATEELRRLTDAWWRASGRDVDGLYSAARAATGEPQYSAQAVRELQELAEERLGPIATFRTEDVVRQTEAGPVSESVERLAELRQPENDAGRVLRAIRNLDPENPRAVRVGEDGRALRDAAGNIQFLSPTETLRTLQQELRDASLAQLGTGDRAPQLAAKALRRKVDEILFDPQVTSERGRRLWRRANRAARERFEAREHVQVMQLFSAAQRGQPVPADFALSLIQPNSFDKLVAIQRVAGERGIETVRGLFRDELVRKAQRSGAVDARVIVNELDRYDAPTLRLLTRNAKEVDQIRAFGRAYEKLASSNLQKAIDTQTARRRFFKVAFDVGQTAQIDEAFEIVMRSGGIEGPLGRSVQAAILDNIIATVERRVPQGRVVSAKLLGDVLQEYSDARMLRFLPLSTRKIIKDVERYKQVVEATSDAGTSLQAAELAADVRQTLVSGETNTLSKLLELFAEFRATSWLFTSPTGRRLLIGTGKPPPELDRRLFRVAGAALLQLANDVDVIDKKRDPMNPLIEATTPQAP